MTCPLPFPTQIDNSALSAFKRCPSYWYWNSLRSIESVGGSIHLTAGGAFATGLEISRKCFYEQGLSAEASIARGLHALILAYGSFEAPEGHVKSLPRVGLALIEYFLQYPLEQDGFVPLELGDGSRAVEFTFAIPLPINNPDTGEPLLYTGRFDALGTWNGATFGCDEKTATQLGPQWTKNWTLDSQFTGYTWATQHFGIHTAGFLVRGISFLSGGYGHAQAIVFRPQWMIDRWYDSTLHTIRMMIAYWQENQFPMALDKHACNSYGGCQYHRLCESREPERWIAGNYLPKVWDPLDKGASL